jgi:hypothetical protein
MYREFRDSREGFDRAEYEAYCAEYEAWLDEHDAEWDGDDLSEYDDEPWDGFRDDVEADADVLRSCGWGNDEDYGYYGGDEEW